MKLNYVNFGQYRMMLANKRILFSFMYFSITAVLSYLGYLHISELRLIESNLFLDSAPSVFAVPIASYICFGLVKEDKKRTALYCTSGLVIYEYLQILIPKRTFDPMDILFTGVGFILTVSLVLVYEKLSECIWERPKKNA
ncbi:hypothetical protein D210916BOD24_20110 [Alteromonas sp. D210916BOD_24]|uniref:hypothetical protein n=1 Tax=Alteromonas sp. D210916BOD_24 TaxID=3157618 RepID=UPI00399D2223